MFELKLVSLFYETVNLITEWFPKKGASSIDRFLLGVAGNRFAARMALWNDVRKLSKAKSFDKICVIADVHIGDAIITQAVILGLRDFFPKARIDYIVSQAAKKLIAGNPDISNLYPVYSDVKAPYPNETEIQKIAGVLRENDYDLVFNFCPFLSPKKLDFPKDGIVGYFGFSASVAVAERDPGSPSQFSYRMHRYVHELFDNFETPKRNGEFRGNRISLATGSIRLADDFLKENWPDPTRKKVLFNPDASLPFTRIPFEAQVSLLKKLAEMPCGILLGAGHKDKGIEDRLWESLNEREKASVKIVPATLPIDVYAAIIDRCDIFITGDTGTLHIAAARKFSDSGDACRNKTAVLQIFGATPLRFYGYDSRQPGYFPTNQDAPSYVYAAPSRCRNLTYIVKDYIVADAACFFDELDVDKIAENISSLIHVR